MSTIDAFRRCPSGRYTDGVVVVERVASGPVGRFAVDTVGGRPRLRHDLTAGEVDNDLAGLLAAVPVEPQFFERLFTGVVLTSAPDPLAGWAAFYAATLTRLTGPSPGEGSIGEFALIYRRARALVRGRRVLDVASCFGFLPLLLHSDGLDVVASDVNSGSMALLAAVAGARGGGPAVLTCSADALPLAAGGADTVLVVHLLEHVPAAVGTVMLAEAQRVARQRVVVAVPYEDEPTAAYGHVRTLDAADLRALGAASGWGYEVVEDSGGWLVLDRPPADP
ncbi:MAG: class I SAM-dependent methyltransferase [Geodermatophilaceae bacterium]|nr:class I SAM-dependent methyltransferase [Geodermatophilaceae bacterium]